MKKVFKTLLVIVLLLVIAAGVLFIAVPMTETRSDTFAFEGSSKWMEGISDQTGLERIYIPGTHDSASQYAQLAFFSKCQASDIYTQLNDGFRYLDIRLGARETEDGAVLTLYHGFCKCRKGPWPWSETLDLDDVLDQCYRFLDEDPSETIVFAVKMEQGSDVAQFQTLLHKYIDQASERWYLSDRIPSLGDCRGKLVLMRRYEDVNKLGEKAGIQLFWEDQGGNDDVSLAYSTEEQPGYTLFVQDRYKYSAEDKWNAFKKSLDSNTAMSARHLNLTFLSTNGTPKFGHPYSYAKDLNKLLLAENISVTEPFWAVIDFSDALLAQKIYSLNK